MLGCEHTGPTRGCQSLMPPSWSVFLTAWPETFTLLDVILKDYVSAPRSPSCTGAALLSSCPFDIVFRRHSNPSCNHIYNMVVPSWTCWTTCNLMLPVLTRKLAELKPRVESIRKDKKRATVCGYHMYHHSHFGGCLAFGFPFYFEFQLHLQQN